MNLDEHQSNKMKLVKSLSQANKYLHVIDFSLILFCSTDILKIVLRRHHSDSSIDIFDVLPKYI